MKNHSIRLLSLVVFFASWSLSNQASATFHDWDIVEAFSSADGSVQFIEMFTDSPGQEFANFRMGGIFSNGESFSFPTDLPSGTMDKSFLVGTTSYNSLAQIDVNVPLPDYVVVDNFFSIAGDKLDLKWFVTNIFDTIIFTAGDLPTDGTNSLNHAFGDPLNTFFSATNSPTNFAGDTGTVTIVSLSADFDEDDDVDGEDFLIWQRGSGSPGGLSQGDANNDGNVDADDLAIWETQYALVADPADFNGDNDVDGEDFLIWQRGFGGPGGLSDGDANNDGNVDGDDLAIWESQYGLSIPLSSISAIPEPQSVCLLLCGLLALSGRRRNAS